MPGTCADSMLPNPSGHAGTRRHARIDSALLDTLLALAPCTNHQAMASRCPSSPCSLVTSPTVRDYVHQRACAPARAPSHRSRAQHVLRTWPLAPCTQPSPPCPAPPPAQPPPPAFGTYIPPCLGLPPLPGMLTTAEFRRIIAGICYKFLYLAAGAAAAGALQQSAWVLTSTRQVRRAGRGGGAPRAAAGARPPRGQGRASAQRLHCSITQCLLPLRPRVASQSNRLRRRYLAAVLAMDVGFFDTQATTGGLLQGLNEDSLVGGVGHGCGRPLVWVVVSCVGPSSQLVLPAALLAALHQAPPPPQLCARAHPPQAVQAAVSAKTGQFLQHSATFIAGYGLAFAKSWVSAAPAAPGAVPTRRGSKRGCARAAAPRAAAALQP